MANRPEPKPWSQPGSRNCSSLAVRPCLPGLGGGVERLADGRVGRVDEVARRVVVDLLLGGDDRVVEAARGVVPGGAGRGRGLELLAEGEEAVPVGHLLAASCARVGRQAGLLEQVGAVADAHGADVGAEAEHRAVRRGGGLLLPVDVAADGVVRPGCRAGPSTCRPGSATTSAIRADLDALDVGDAAARREPGLQGRPVLVLALVDSYWMVMSGCSASYFLNRPASL